MLSYRLLRSRPKGQKIRRLLGQAVKTSPFHGGNTGSIPVGVILILTYQNKFVRI